MSYQNKGETGVVAVVTSEGRGGNFTFAAGADPAVAIENAWSYLNTLGGGTLVTKGPGETWVFQTRVDSQGDNVTWISDWSLTLQAQNALDDDVVRARYHDNLKFVGLHIDGNKSGGDWTPGSDYMGLYIRECDDVVVERCLIENVYIYGLQVHESNRFEVVGNKITESRWNNLHLYNAYDGRIHGNILTECSDVACSFHGASSFIAFYGNTIKDIDNMEGGGGNSHWGAVSEGGTTDITIANNVFDNVGGIGAGTSNVGATKYRVLVIGNVFNDCGLVYDWQTGIMLTNLTDGGAIGNVLTGNGARGIYSADSQDIMIQNNRITGYTNPIDVARASVVRPMIMGNNWEGCTNNAQTIGSTNPRITANINTAGAWWATGDAPN